MARADMGRNDSDRTSTDCATPDERTVRLSAIVEENQDGPDTCTIFQPDLPKVERMSTWITATDPHFVRLAEMR